MSYAKTTEEIKKEGWTFSFGSIMGAYALINQGKQISTDKFLKDVDKIYNKSISLVYTALKEEVPQMNMFQQSEKSAKIVKEQSRIENDSKEDSVRQEVS